jgi:hypothetical protein
MGEAPPADLAHVGEGERPHEGAVAAVALPPQRSEVLGVDPRHASAACRRRLRPGQVLEHEGAPATALASLLLDAQEPVLVVAHLARAVQQVVVQEGAPQPRLREVPPRQALFRSVPGRAEPEGRRELQQGRAGVLLGRDDLHQGAVALAIVEGAEGDLARAGEPRTLDDERGLEVGPQAAQRVVRAVRDLARIRGLGVGDGGGLGGGLRGRRLGRCGLRPAGRRARRGERRRQQQARAPRAPAH